jgi:hypothetical protein
MGDERVNQHATEVQPDQPTHAASLPALAPNVAQILALQRSAGNAAVARMLEADCFVTPPDPSEPTEGETEEERQQRLAGGGGQPGEAPHDEEAEHASAILNPWAASPAPAPAWGAEAIAGPKPMSWGAVQPTALPDGAAAISGPTSADLKTVQHAGSGTNLWRLGITTWPAGAKAPTFDFNTSSKTGSGGAVEWYAAPTLTQSADEGSNQCLFVDAGTHKTEHSEAGKDVYWIMSGPMSAADSNAELEHSQDMKLAYEISLKEAEDVLKAKVVGKTFGPKASEAEAKQAVLDTITGNLTHPGLGSDQTKWAATYETLYRKTLERDAKKWHSFGLGNRTVMPSGDISYKINAGSTSIGVTPSKDIVKY